VASSYIPETERIVTIEDAAELQLHQEHLLSLESRPPNLEGKGQITIRDLVRNTLRMRPDRIVVGEVRGGEALDMLQAMNTGHDGSLTTVHSNSPRDTLSRVETMVLMAGFDLPVRAIREQISSAVDLIVHIGRLRDGTRRVTHVTEVEGMEGDIITLQDLFLFDFGMGVDEDGKYLGRLKATGIRPSFSDQLSDIGIRLPGDLFDPEPFARRSDSFTMGR
jgi:pilus assembly protein CpaF